MLYMPKLCGNRYVVFEITAVTFLVNYRHKSIYQKWFVYQQWNHGSYNVKHPGHCSTPHNHPLGKEADDICIRVESTTEHGALPLLSPKVAAACWGNRQQPAVWARASAVCSFAVTFRTHGHYLCCIATVLFGEIGIIVWERRNNVSRKSCKVGDLLAMPAMNSYQSQSIMTVLIS